MSRRALTVKMPLVRAIAVCDVESEAEAEAKAVCHTAMASSATTGDEPKRYT